MVYSVLIGKYFFSVCCIDKKKFCVCIVIIIIIIMVIFKCYFSGELIALS